jgi:hypothetical protein
VGGSVKLAGAPCRRTTLVNFSPKGNTFHKQTTSNTAIPLANYMLVVLLFSVFAQFVMSRARPRPFTWLPSGQLVLPWLFLAALAAVGTVTMPTVGRLLAPRLHVLIMQSGRET